MTQPKSITIVGGGLAGLTLGVALRRLEIPVTLWEAGHYPRHRVCGEFISGRGQGVLQSLGLFGMFREAGAVFGRTARFFLGKATSPARVINPPALCLSRLKMDELLATRFSSLGGDLRVDSRWGHDQYGEGIVIASGRTAKPLEKGWRWFGLKVHARNVSMEADLEMHAAADGYVGLCRLPGNEVNICGLFRARPGNSSTRPEKLLAGIDGTQLQRRLAQAQFDDRSFCSVAGLSLQARSASGQDCCRVGDALTMIPPVTGNGMSMAFESAGIALQPLIGYARGELDWTSARRVIARQCDAAFRERLFYARWLQVFMLHPLSRGNLGALFLKSGRLWDQLFTRTR